MHTISPSYKRPAPWIALLAVASAIVASVPATTAAGNIDTAEFLVEYLLVGAASIRRPGSITTTLPPTTAGAGLRTRRPVGGSRSATAGDDVLIGNAGDDTIYGLAGNDTIRGLGGRRHLPVAPGNDILVGGAGNDVLNGGSGNDVLRSNDGEFDVFAVTPVTIEPAPMTPVSTTSTASRSASREVLRMTAGEMWAVVAFALAVTVSWCWFG